VSRREEELRRVLREEIDKETERQAILSGGWGGRGRQDEAWVWWVDGVS
jgi:hypothetical protein